MRLRSYEPDVSPRSIWSGLPWAPDTRFRLASMTPIKRAAASPILSISLCRLLLLCMSRTKPQEMQRAVPDAMHEDDDSYCMTPREIAATVAFWLLLACAALFVLAWYFLASTAGA